MSMKILADFCISINVPLKNNIETKDSCKFDKIVREIICEFQQARKYVHQILKIRLLLKEDLGWYGRANFVGKLFDSIHVILL